MPIQFSQLSKCYLCQSFWYHIACRYHKGKITKLVLHASFPLGLTLVIWISELFPKCWVKKCTCLSDWCKMRFVCAHEQPGCKNACLVYTSATLFFFFFLNNLRLAFFYFSFFLGKKKKQKTLCYMDCLRTYVCGFSVQQNWHLSIQLTWEGVSSYFYECWAWRIHLGYPDICRL